jgi:hypothetical protein
MKALALTLLLVGGASGDTTERFRMTVSLADPFTLNVKLTWQGEAPLTMNSAWLPWGRFYGMLLVATSADPLARPLESPPRIDDPMGKRLTLKPGESVEGRIALTDRFPSIEAAAGKHDVLIFWSYDLRSVQGIEPPRVGGWLLIPKTASADAHH